MLRRTYKKYLKGMMPGYASVIVGEREDGLWEDLYMSDNNETVWKFVSKEPPVALEYNVIEHDMQVGWVYTEVDSLFVELL